MGGIAAEFLGELVEFVLAVDDAAREAVSAGAIIPQ